MSGYNERIHEDGPMNSGFSEIQRKDGSYHRTLYDRNTDNHISWDTDKYDNYSYGSGHEDRDGRVVNQWDR